MEEDQLSVVERMPCSTVLYLSSDRKWEHEKNFISDPWLPKKEEIQ